MARILLISHEPSGSPGTVGEVLRERGHEVELHVVLEDRDRPNTAYPDPSGFDAVMAFGSFWSVYDADARPWVDPEVHYLRRLIDDDIAYLGICFGGQMLAEALGGAVEPAPVPEIGLVEFPAADGLPSGPWFTWHGDRVALPADVEVIARNEHAVQLFRRGRQAGTQFHPEANVALVSSWVAAGGDHIPGPMTGTEVIAGVTEQQAHLRANCEALVDWFLGEVAAISR